MRTETKDGVTLMYPDNISFAFNVAMMYAKGNVTKMSANVRCGTARHDYSVDAINGTCYADLRQFVLSFFDGHDFSVDYDAYVESTHMTANVGVTVQVVTPTSTVSFDFNSIFVWGSLRNGEGFNQYREQVMFLGYPYTIGIYNDGTGSSVKIASGGKTLRTPNVEGRGMFNVNLSDLGTYEGRKLEIYDSTGTFAMVTFDGSFDYTFMKSESQKNRLVATVEVENPRYDDSVYLRWVDRKGFYRYWLFKKGNVSMETSTNGEVLYNNMGSASAGMLGLGGRRQGYVRSDSVEICAPVVDSDTFDMLAEINTSPVVDRYNPNGTWSSVLVAASSTSKVAGMVLQDFVTHYSDIEFNPQTL